MKAVVGSPFVVWEPSRKEIVPPPPTLRFDSTSEKTRVPPVAAVQSWAVTVCVLPYAKVVVAVSEIIREVGDCANDTRLDSVNDTRPNRQVMLFTNFPFGACRHLSVRKYFPIFLDWCLTVLGNPQEH